MEKRLDADKIRRLLSERGWQQGDLAQAMDASDASVSQWLKGEHAPRPGTLLKLAKVLRKPLQELLLTTAPLLDQPQIAFRRKGQQQTTEINEDDALSQGYALERVAEHLEPRAFRPREFQDPTTRYEHVEELANLVRGEVTGQSDGTASPTWLQLVEWFSRNGAILIPVFWGERHHHGNALHVYLPSSGHTFVYVNLDSEELDFKFWLAHEMAHMLTPSLVGTEEGEDFADVFAGSLLFPQRLASSAYSSALDAKSQAQVLAVLTQYAVDAGVSLHTVYMQCRELALAKGAKPLVIPEARLHQQRRVVDRRMGRTRVHLFSEHPSASEYVDITRSQFKSKFFDALFRYLKVSADGAAFVSRVLHCSLADAVEIRALLGAAPDERDPG